MITLERVVRLGQREGPGTVASTRFLARNSAGDIFVAHGDGASLATAVWVFDRDGTFVRRIGAEGDGPGEFRAISRLHVRHGDTLEVFDGRLMRRTTYSPELELIETTPVAARYGMSVFLGRNVAVVNHHIAEPETVGYPLHLVDHEGDILRSFGAETPQYRADEPFRVLRVLASAGEGSVWSVGRGSYFIERWDTLGRRLDSFDRDADWFEPYLLDRGPSVSSPPQPQVGSMETDADGRLWVMVYVPADDWQRGMELNDPDLLYDTLIEVIDPGSRSLLAQERIDGLLLGFLPDEDRPLAVEYVEDELGYPFLDLWHLSLSEN